MLRLVGESPEGGKGGKRGEISSFTWLSRLRLLRQLACIDQGKAPLPAFVTLTYPGVFCPEAAEWKCHLDLWLKRLRYTFPQVSGWWKLEPQKRGAPHFHLLVFGLTDLEEFKPWLSESWFEVVDSQDMKHLLAGTSVEWVRTWRGVMNYAAKYMGKTKLLEEMAPGDRAIWAKVGRWWGSFGRKLLPMSAVEIGLTLSQFDQLKAALLAIQEGAKFDRFSAMKARGVVDDLSPLGKWALAYQARVRGEEAEPGEEGWERRRVDAGLSAFISAADAAKLIEAITGVSIEGAEGRQVRPGDFSC